VVDVNECFNFFGIFKISVDSLHIMFQMTIKEVK